MSIGSLARILRAEIWGGAAQTVSPITLGFIHENYVAGRTHPRPACTRRHWPTGWSNPGPKSES